MAFVFNSTPSDPAANSYVTVSSADDYFYAHFERDFWTTLSDQDKQSALVMATRRIDSEKWTGYPTLATQNLQWPRQSVLGRNYGIGRVIIDSTIIPKELMQATFEQALWYMKKNADETTIVDDYDLETLSDYKIGPIDVKIKNGIKADRLPSKVIQLLSAIGPRAWLGAFSGYRMSL